MNMDIVNYEHRLCTCCMEEHDVKIVNVPKKEIFKDKEVNYIATYSYCELADELYMDEEQLRANNLQLKDAYRKAEGLLTTNEIIKIRSKYKISQSDLCTILGWGGKTIARYESFQVQDKAHDTILRKIDQDPEWFVTLLKGAKSDLSGETYEKYFSIATALYEDAQDAYLKSSINAKYARFRDNNLCQGNTQLSLDKAIDMIRYFSSIPEQVTTLYKVKLMKLMWYADTLSYKLRGYSITGLAYQALPMGAVPVGHEAMIALKGVPCEEVDIGEISAYHFTLENEVTFPHLTNDDKAIIDTVVNKLGKMSRVEIVKFMHNEKAYTQTSPYEIIPYSYAEYLQI